MLLGAFVVARESVAKVLSLEVRLRKSTDLALSAMVARSKTRCFDVELSRACVPKNGLRTHAPQGRNLRSKCRFLICTNEINIGTFPSSTMSKHVELQGVVGNHTRIISLH